MRAGSRAFVSFGRGWAAITVAKNPRAWRRHARVISFWFKPVPSDQHYDHAFQETGQRATPGEAVELERAFDPGTRHDAERSPRNGFGKRSRRSRPRGFVPPALELREIRPKCWQSKCPADGIFAASLIDKSEPLLPSAKGKPDPADRRRRDIRVSSLGCLFKGNSSMRRRRRISGLQR